MITTLLNFWADALTAKLQDDTDDMLKMRIVKLMPFQEDPTRKAPYLVIGINADKGMIPDKDKSEIGGPTLWIAHYRIKAAPKVQVKSANAYYLVDILMQRIVWVLQTSALRAPTALNASYMDNYDWFVIDKVLPHVYGGDGEWLSYVEFEFSCRLAQPFRYGTYPAELELPA